MRYEDFVESIEADVNPAGDMSTVLQALWWDGKGAWDTAHDLAQSAGSKDGDWIHAYLHRKEGDEGNAGYWYSRSGKPFYNGSLEKEWESLVRHFLA